MFNNNNKNNDSKIKNTAAEPRAKIIKISFNNERLPIYLKEIPSLVELIRDKALLNKVRKKEANYGIRLIMTHFECGVNDGIHYDEINDRYLSALHFAAQEGNDVLVRAILKQGALVDLPTFSNSPSNFEKPSLFKKLFSKKKIIEERGETALHLAARAGNAEICKSLLHHGASKRVPNNEGLTPVDVATGKAVEIFKECQTPKTISPQSSSEIIKEIRKRSNTEPCDLSSDPDNNNTNNNNKNDDNERLFFQTSESSFSNNSNGSKSNATDSVQSDKSELVEAKNDVSPENKTCIL